MGISFCSIFHQKKGVPKSIISKWIEPEQYPNYQTYWFNQLGHNEFRNYYADFAAEVSADYNFFTREQYKEALRCAIKLSKVQIILIYYLHIIKWKFWVIFMGYIQSDIKI